MQDYERQDTPTFNMSLPTLNRIHVSLQELNKHFIEGNPIYRKRYLMQLYLELDAFLDEQERESGLKELQYIASNIYFQNATLMFSRDIEDRMFLFELWCRRKLKEKGLLMAEGEDVTQAAYD